jgi:cytochrome c2
MIFNGEEVLTSSSCHDCHSLDGADRLNVVGVPLAPSLQGISGRAQQRVPGMSAEAYIRKSIVDPQSYVAEGYEGKMGSIWSMLLKDDDIDDLVAFLLTQ